MGIVSTTYFHAIPKIDRFLLLYENRIRVPIESPVGARTVFVRKLSIRFVQIFIQWYCKDPGADRKLTFWALNRRLIRLIYWVEIIDRIRDAIQLSGVAAAVTIIRALTQPKWRPSKFSVALSLCFREIFSARGIIEQLAVSVQAGVINSTEDCRAQPPRRRPVAMAALAA